MRKYGKYERMPDGTRAKQPEPKTVLLQTYFTSLVCIILCTPVFWPRDFHGLYSPWGHKESDTTEQLSLHIIVSTFAF